MKKKTLVLAISLVLLICMLGATLVACDNDGQENNDEMKWAEDYIGYYTMHGDTCTLKLSKLSNDIYLYGYKNGKMLAKEQNYQNSIKNFVDVERDVDIPADSENKINTIINSMKGTVEIEKYGINVAHDRFVFSKLAKYFDYEKEWYVFESHVKQPSIDTDYVSIEIKNDAGQQKTILNYYIDSIIVNGDAQSQSICLQFELDKIEKKVESPEFSLRIEPDKTFSFKLEDFQTKKYIFTSYTEDDYVLNFAITSGYEFFYNGSQIYDGAHIHVEKDEKMVIEIKKTINATSNNSMRITYAEATV